jgi:hypothetical protein
LQAIPPTKQAAIPILFRVAIAALAVVDTSEKRRDMLIRQ